MEKVLNPIFGASCVRSFEGQKDFDKYYIDLVVKQVIKRTGEGEEDFIIVDKEILTKRDIAKEIHAQAGDAGIDAYLKNFELTGVSPIESFAGVSDEIIDTTKMPQTLADAQLLAKKTGELFESLPRELVGKMSYEQFIANFTQEKFDEYIASITPKKEEKKEGAE